MSTSSGLQQFDTKHPDYTKYAPEWQRIRDCMEGERRIVEQGTLYLPHPAKYPEKDDQDGKRYTDYQMRAAFINATGRTHESMMGLAFDKPIDVQLSGRLSELEENADGKCQPLTQFVRDAMSLGCSTGRGGVFVDYGHPAEFDENGNMVAVSLAAAESQPLRLKLYDEKGIINWRSVGGKLTLLVLKDTEEVSNDKTFDHMTVTTWREMRIVDGKAVVRLWFRNSNSEAVTNGNGVLIPKGDSSLPAPDAQMLPIMWKGAPATEIPFAWLGSVNNDETIDAPPLADIASLNIKHYQAEADVAELAHITGQPTVYVTGLTPEWAREFAKDGLGLGVGKGIKLGTNNGTNNEIGIVQAAERSASLALAERRENQMGKLGAALVERGTAPKTATEAEFDAKTDNSKLSMVATNVEACIRHALDLAAMFTDGAGTVTLNKRYSNAVIDSQALVAMMAAVQAGNMLLSDFIRWMQGIGIADESISVDEYKAQLEQQAATTLGGAMTEFDQHGQPIQPAGGPNPAPAGDSGVPSTAQEA